MKRLALALAVLASPAAAAPNDVSGAFASLSAVVVDMTGAELGNGWCDDRMCEGYAENEQMQMMWPEGGWISLTYFPYAHDLTTNLAFCTAVVEFATGLGHEGSGMLAGQLVGTATTQDEARVEAGTAELRARRTGSGMVECEARLPEPL